MALAQATVFEVRTTGNAANGGGYRTGAGTPDYSQQDSPQYALTSATSSGAGNVVLHSSAAADMVGQICQVRTGTNFTPGFFEITSVSVGVSFTCSTNQAGTAICTGVGASGVINIGGAYKFGSATDSIFAAGLQQGFTVHIKAGTYTQTTTMIFTDSIAAKPFVMSGYNSVRGDSPTGANRPLLNLAGGSNGFGSVGTISNLSFTGIAASPVTSDGAISWTNCKFVNTSTTSNRNAVTSAAEDFFIKCEFVSQAGNAFSCGAASYLVGCYIHDSPVGVKFTSAGDDITLLNNIIAGCGTAISITGANTALLLISGNTLYGSERKDGTGVSIATGALNVKLVNNTISGFATGITHATANTSNFSLNNNFFNNTTDRTNWATGTGDIALTPGFTSVTTVSGTAGSVSGSVLTDAGANFSNVVPGTDLLYVVSGTGATVTPTSLSIASVTATTITTTVAIGGSGTNISYFVRTGQNFAVGANLKAVGMPAAFSGSSTTAYTDIGAVQRKEPVSTDPGITNVRSGTGYTLNDSVLTGTLDLPVVADVRLATTFDGASKTGTARIPSTANVKTGYAYDSSDSLTGTYDGSDRNTDPGVANVRSGTAYKSNSTSNNRTGTASIPVAANVRSGTAVDATTGALDLPAVANVRLTTTFDSGSKTGTARIPAIANVKIGYAYDSSDSLTGTYVASERYSDPGVANVRVGTAYQSNSTTNNRTGTTVIPAASNVRLGTSTDATMGTLAVPSVGNVRSGTSVDAGIGTLVVPSLANTAYGVSGDGGTGTYDGSSRWSDPGNVNVADGVTYLANAASKVGTREVVTNVISNTNLTGPSYEAVLVGE